MTKTLRILIAEDEKPLAHALQLKLGHEGFQVKVVDNGHDAVAAVDAEKFDVLLLDMMMPIMDGFQVLERLQKHPQKPHIFVLSNLSVHDDQTRVSSLGADKYFIKSDISLTKLVEEIKNAV